VVGLPDKAFKAILVDYPLNTVSADLDTHAGEFVLDIQLAPGWIRSPKVKDLFDCGPWGLRRSHISRSSRVVLKAFEVPTVVSGFPVPDCGLGNIKVAGGFADAVAVADVVHPFQPHQSFLAYILPLAKASSVGK
jgi:hypothetical protein